MTDTHKGDDAALIDELEGVVSDLESSGWARAPQCVTTLKRVMAALAARGAGQGEAEWIRYYGNGRPVPNGTPIEIQQRDGKVRQGEYWSEITWVRDGGFPSEDVMFWRRASPTGEA